MTDYKRVKTSAEVWNTIHTRHPELRVLSNYDLSKGKLFTRYGFPQSDFPIIEALTTWDINREHPEIRKNEKHEYWLCLPYNEYEDEY